MLLLLLASAGTGIPSIPVVSAHPRATHIEHDRATHVEHARTSHKE